MELLIYFVLYTASLFLFFSHRHQKTKSWLRAANVREFKAFVRYNEERKRVLNLCKLSFEDAWALGHAIERQPPVTAEEMIAARETTEHRQYTYDDVEKAVAAKQLTAKRVNE